MADFNVSAPPDCRKSRSRMTALSRTSVLRLSVQGFRNLSQITLAPAARLNLIFGHNGHGKTSLIEALYVLCTSQSFRTSRLLEAIQDGEEQARIVGQTESFGLRHELRATVAARSRSFQVDGKSPRRRLEYALRTPVIAFAPSDLELCSGPASHRRTLLDRAMLYLDPGGAQARLEYQKSARERHRLLVEKGPRAPELDAYEAVVARSGARLSRGRRETAERLLEELAPAFRRMAAPELSGSFQFQPGGVEGEQEFVRQLRERRQKDLLRGGMTFGPGRDDLLLSVDGRPARTHASQGQQRIVTLALKIAELSCVRDVTKTQPLLLLDDVSSELDSDRVQAVFGFLQSSEAQVFVTTTRPELFSSLDVEPAERADFAVENGQITVGVVSS